MEKINYDMEFIKKELEKIKKQIRKLEVKKKRYAFRIDTKINKLKHEKYQLQAIIDIDRIKK